jgi:hypothetical protein
MKKILAAAALAAIVFPSYAEDTNPKAKFPAGLQFGVGASGTSGLNGFVGYANKDFESAWWKRLGVRLDFASTAPVKSRINSAIDSALSGGFEISDGLVVNGGQITAKHIGAMVDFYPFGNTWFLGGWRLTGGYVAGSTDLVANLSGDMDGLPGDSVQFELDGKHYKYSGNEIHGKADANWKYSGPYLGTGFDLGLLWGIKIYVDAGVVFTSRTATVSLDVPLDGLQDSPDGLTGWDYVKGRAESDFYNAKQNALDEANRELEKIKFYPMAKLGFMYRF